jgi:hypothetical protein
VLDVITKFMELWLENEKMCANFPRNVLSLSGSVARPSVPFFAVVTVAFSRYAEILDPNLGSSGIEP